jgi:molecular chaperone DnaJ
MNPFEVLEISENSTETDIKKAFKTLAKKYHPDTNDGKTEDKFKEINEAYRILKENNWQKPIQQNEFNLFSQFSGFDFGNIFGGFKTNATQNVSVIVESISLEEAYNGVNKIIRVNEKTKCLICDGRSVILNNKSCQKCNGSGRMSSQNGALFFAVTCKFCKGFGKEILQNCSDCNGVGFKIKEKSFNLNIPKGTYEGEVFKLSKDLVVKIVFAQHKSLGVNGLDTISEEEVDMFDAVIGCSKEVYTLRGVTKVVIPKCCQPNSVLRLKEHGLVKNKTIGDHYIKVKVNIPKLTEEQEKLLLQIKQTAYEKTND